MGRALGRAENIHAATGATKGAGIRTATAWGDTSHPTRACSAAPGLSLLGCVPLLTGIPLQGVEQGL